MRVLVTRPLAQAAGWVQRLQAEGIDAAALPLIAIADPADPSAVGAAWAVLDRYRLVVFVSPNAVQAFFGFAPAGAGWPLQARAASPGPGTTAVLIGLGVALAQIDEPAADAPQYDSEALWAQLEGRDWRGASVLVVRGTRGRDWLAARLVERGAQVDELAAYARAAPILSATESALLAAALAAPRRHVWLFSSSEAIDQLAELAAPAVAVPGDAWHEARAVATHPRIAARARQLGFGEVLEARPTPAAVVACIQSIRP